MIQLSNRQVAFTLGLSMVAQMAGITFGPVFWRNSRPIEPPAFVYLRLTPAVPAPPAAAAPKARAEVQTAAPKPIVVPANVPVVYKAPEVALFEAPEIPGVVGGLEGVGIPGGVIGGIVTETIRMAAEIQPPPPPAAPPPPAPAKAAPPPPKSIVVSPEVQEAKLLYFAKPAYPPLAKQGRIQGTVRLRAVIARDGSVENVTLLEGHPLLVKPAIDAAAQFRYRPTLVDGVPVEVVTFINVRFQLVM